MSVSVGTQYNNGDTAQNYRRKVRGKVIENQEALTFPRLACSLRQDSPSQQPLSYADDPRLWATSIQTPQIRACGRDDLTRGTYVVHNIRGKPPSFDGPLRSAALPLGSLCFVRPGRQLCWPMLKGRRTSQRTAPSVRFGRRNVQRKCHVHPTGGKDSGVCLFGNIVMSPVTPLRSNGITVGDDCLGYGSASLGTCRTFTLAQALLG